MVDPQNVYPDLKRTSTSTSSGSKVIAYSSILPGDGPIMTLIHGFPQAAYMWRHVIPLLEDRVSLFIPELPGYGVSSPPKKHDKLTVGTALLEALDASFPPANGKRKIILAGHDRGARIVHRLAVNRSDFASKFDFLSLVMLDIAPTLEQWRAFSDPATLAGYYHWPFLANVDLATEMLSAYGGDKYCLKCLDRIVGRNPEGQMRMNSGGSREVYSANFAKLECIIGSAEDYAAECFGEPKMQADDFEARKKISIRTCIMWSQGKLGARLDIEGLWKKWVAEESLLTANGIGDDYGHYLPEECPDIVAQNILSFTKQDL